MASVYSIEVSCDNMPYKKVIFCSSLALPLCLNYFLVCILIAVLWTNPSLCLFPDLYIAAAIYMCVSLYTNCISNQYINIQVTIADTQFHPLAPKAFKMWIPCIFQIDGRKKPFRKPWIWNNFAKRYNYRIATMTVGEKGKWPFAAQHSANHSDLAKRYIKTLHKDMCLLSSRYWRQHSNIRVHAYVKSLMWFSVLSIYRLGTQNTKTCFIIKVSNRKLQIKYL